MNPFKKEKKQISLFITAGYPELNSLPEQIALLENTRIDFLEIGIPFSDPMADGPIIQNSSSIAIENGMNIDRMFDQLQKLSVSIPLVIMSYLNPIMHYGIDTFLSQCSEVGIKHLIIPDISLEIYNRYYKELFDTYGITLCFLVTPKTAESRIQQMAEASKNGFIYLVRSSKTTGSASSHEEQYDFSHIRSLCGDTPMMTGFGISSKEDIDAVHKYSDGAIIGSAYIKAIESGKSRDFLGLIKLPPSEGDIGGGSL